MCGFLFKVAWKIDDCKSFKWTFLEKRTKYFTFTCTLIVCLRFNSTEWCGNRMFPKVIIHSPKVLTGNFLGGGGGGGGEG